MTRPPLSFEYAPGLTDEAANEIREFLYEIVTAFESTYYGQLKRYDQQREALWLELQAQHREKEKQQELFVEFDDDLPNF